MLKKLAFAVIAFPTVLFLVSNLGVGLGPLSFIVAHKTIFWAAGGAVLLYSMLSYAWVLLIGMVGIYLLAEFLLGSVI